MTGLGNRRALDKALPAAEADQSLSIVIFDINNFGAANKELGHYWGDKYIRTAAYALAREYSRCFRFGGDEFVAICPKGLEELTIEFVEHSFGSAFIKHGLVVSITGSHGNTLAEADEKLQELKAIRKARDL